MIKTTTLLMGPVCTGKSFALRTCLAEYPDAAGHIRKGAGRQVLALSMEPGFEDTLGDCTCQMGMHVHSIRPLDADWDDLEGMAKRIQATTGDIQKIIDPDRKNHDQLLSLYATMANFTCDRCNKSFGLVDALGPEFVLAYDGLTGLSRMAVQFLFGLKPSKSWPEFDAAQQTIENVLRKCVSLDCSFVLIAHQDREPDPMGGFKLTMHTVGNKLAYRLTKDLFSEIVYTNREGDKFTWSTTEDNMELKARRLPFSARLEPNFTQILEP